MWINSVRNAVYSPASCFADDQFANVYGRFINVSGQFSDVS